MQWGFQLHICLHYRLAPSSSFDNFMQRRLRKIVMDPQEVDELWMFVADLSDSPEKFVWLCTKLRTAALGCKDTEAASKFDHAQCRIARNKQSVSCYKCMHTEALKIQRQLQKIRCVVHCEPNSATTHRILAR